MRLVIPPYDINIELKENTVNVLSVENPKAYSIILRDFWNQTQGMEGEILLSEGEKIYAMSKIMECVFNPFDIDCNDKKILNRLYQELKDYTVTNLVEENAELNSCILQYMDKIVDGVPYALDYIVDFDIVALLKIYGVSIQTSGETLLENIVEYLRVMKQICGISCFVFVGLKSYLNESELKQLYEFSFYEKINIIIIEPIHTPTLMGEKCWILDNDLCLISP